MILDENLFQDYRRPLKESAEAAKRILHIEVMSGVNADGFTAIVKDSISGEEIFRQKYYYGYDASYDRRWASSRAPYVTDIINDLKSQYNVSNVEVTAGKNLFRGDSMSSDAVEKFKNKYLNESISLSEDQLDKAMTLVDEIHEACQRIYSYNEDGEFAEGLDLNEWSIYSAAADLHDMLESSSLAEHATSLFKEDYAYDPSKNKRIDTRELIYDINNVMLYRVNMKIDRAFSLGDERWSNVVVAASEQEAIETYKVKSGGFGIGWRVVSVKPAGQATEKQKLKWADKVNMWVQYNKIDPKRPDVEEVLNWRRDYLSAKWAAKSSKSLKESTEEDEPYSSKEVGQELKSITNNWKDDSGVCRCYYKEEKQHAVKILKQHYKIVETSQDGDWTVIAFETPIQKESMLEDYLRESNYEERAAKLSDRSLDDMIDLMAEFVAENPDNKKYSDYLNSLKAERASRNKEAQYANSRRAKRDDFGLDRKYPYYVTLYHEYPIYEPAEGGYYYAGLEAEEVEGFDSFKDAMNAIDEIAEELNSDDYNLVKKSRTEYRDYGDKYIGTGSILCIENNKQFRSRERGYQPYE